MAIAGAGQAMLGHIGQVQASSARNRNRARLYKQQQGKLYGDHFANITNYYTRGVDAERQWAENAIAASRGFNMENAKINKAIAQALRKNEEDFITYSSDVRLARAAERGNRRTITSLRAKLGRAKSSRQALIDSQIDTSYSNILEIARRREQANIKARHFIGLEPIRGPEPLKPQWDKGPGLFSLFANMAIGAAQGAMMGKSLQAPKTGLPGLKEWTTDMPITEGMSNYSYNTSILTGGRP